LGSWSTGLVSNASAFRIERPFGGHTGPVPSFEDGTTSDAARGWPVGDQLGTTATHTVRHAAPVANKHAGYGYL
jgi:hypothetical protein